MQQPSTEKKKKKLQGPCGTDAAFASMKRNQESSSANEFIIGLLISYLTLLASQDPLILSNG